MDDWLMDVQSELLRSDISELPVVNAHGHVCGLIGREDLLTAARRTGEGGDDPRMQLPRARVRDFMRTMVAVVSPTQGMDRAARLMVRRRRRRLFVARNGQLLGVLSASDLMRIAGELAISTPLEQIMSESIVSVKVSDTVALATERLSLSHHQGLVVVDRSWPVGIFTVAQALVAREASSEQTVQRWMDPRLPCLPCGAPAYHAAERAATWGVDHILATDATGPRGIVTALDFGRLIAGNSTA